MFKQKLVYLCSPFRGDTETNIENAKRYSKSILIAGYIPVSTHLMFNGVLDDKILFERETALKAGLVLVAKCCELWIFGSHISDGMKAEIELAESLNIPIKTVLTDGDCSNIK